MTTKPNSGTVSVSPKLLPCPFCGAVPRLPDGDGTQYEIECDECGQASSSVQICDLMTIEERANDEFKNYRYGEEFVERAKLDAIERWNTRVHPADQQGEPVAVMYEDGSVLTKADCIDDEVFAICCKVQKPLYLHPQPATAKVGGEVLEKLKELVSAVRSINRSPKHEIRVIGDDKPCYAQRKEWVEWLLSICDDADEVAKLNGAAKVVLPERLDIPHRGEFESANQHAAAVGEAKSYNACLDEVAKLNGIET